jgi:hypothetical protein
MTTANQLASLGNSPAFNVYNSASQSFAANANTVIQFNVKNGTAQFFDTAGAFNNTGSTATLNGLSVPAYAFMPPVAGYYQINGNMTLSASSGIISNSILKNGSVISGSTTPLNASYTGSSVGNIVYLNGTTDYIQLVCNQTYSSALSSLASRADLNWFSGVLMRAA